MLISHKSRMAPEMKKKDTLFCSFSGSSSCIRHANYMYLLFQTNTWETMKQSHPWQVLGAYLTLFTELPKSAFQLSQKRKHGIKVHELWLMPRRQMLRDTRTSVLAVHLSSQPEQGRFRAPTTACSGGKPWKKWMAAGRGSTSSSCHASSTETWGVRSETCFCSTVRRGCLAAALVKALKTSEQDVRPRDWGWLCLGRSWSQGRGGRSQSSQSISDPRLKKEETTIERKLIQAHQQFLPWTVCFECSPSNKKELFLETLPKWLVITQQTTPCSWGHPPAVHGAAPHTATRKPRTFSKYALKGVALPCLSFQKLFQGSPESSHTGLLRDTKPIMLVCTSKTCPQNYLIPVISTWHDRLFFLTRLQLHLALRQSPKEQSRDGPAAQPHLGKLGLTSGRTDTGDWKMYGALSCASTV